jgi:hypothetical protein
MNTNTDAVQELKSERVQEELAVADQEPLVILLKSERVQQPETVTSNAEVVSSSTYELMVNPCERVTIGLEELRVTIYLDGLKVG